ncbi:uncharacterized protein KY384_004720 [Bacidia gigantensis]|uniref:uncharacterized protein n=1 Tax=Bacidia gigantensis TaxID=2732470 RepID=UPI001D0579CD|nr:uncharacterized protein KY384_004720 [Bacidia gigantensis]KAG8530220.1 hypothetical protein KY384_004720 [Bacidia gigantensis]
MKSFPAELLTLVGDEVAAPENPTAIRDLKSLRQVNRLCASITTSLLFRNIIVLIDTKGLQGLVCIAEHQQLSQYVHKLALKPIDNHAADGLADRVEAREGGEIGRLRPRKPNKQQLPLDNTSKLMKAIPRLEKLQHLEILFASRRLLSAAYGVVTLRNPTHSADALISLVLEALSHSTIELKSLRIIPDGDGESLSRMVENAGTGGLDYDVGIDQQLAPLSKDHKGQFWLPGRKRVELAFPPSTLQELAITLPDWYNAPDFAAYQIVKNIGKMIQNSSDDIVTLGIRKWQPNTSDSYFLMDRFEKENIVLPHLKNFYLYNFKIKRYEQLVKFLGQHSQSLEAIHFCSVIVRYLPYDNADDWTIPLDSLRQFDWQRLRNFQISTRSPNRSLHVAGYLKKECEHYITYYSAEDLGLRWSRGHIFMSSFFSNPINQEVADTATDTLSPPAASVASDMDRIPPEILQLIVENIKPEDEERAVIDDFEYQYRLAHLRLVNKTFADLIAPLLFHTIPLWIGGKSLLNLSALSEHPTISTYVKTIRLSNLQVSIKVGLGNMQYLGSRAKDLDGRSILYAETSAKSALVQVFMRLPNFQHLELTLSNPWIGAKRLNQESGRIKSENISFQGSKPFRLALEALTESQKLLTSLRIFEDETMRDPEESRNDDQEAFLACFERCLINETERTLTLSIIAEALHNMKWSSRTWAALRELEIHLEMNAKLLEINGDHRKRTHRLKQWRIMVKALHNLRKIVLDLGTRGSMRGYVTDYLPQATVPKLIDLRISNSCFRNPQEAVDFFRPRCKRLERVALFKVDWNHGEHVQLVLNIQYMQRFVWRSLKRFDWSAGLGSPNIDIGPFLRQETDEFPLAE